MTLMLSTILIFLFYNSKEVDCCAYLMLFMCLGREKLSSMPVGGGAPAAAAAAAPAAAAAEEKKGNFKIKIKNVTSLMTGLFQY